MLANQSFICYRNSLRWHHVVTWSGSILASVSVKLIAIHVLSRVSTLLFNLMLWSIHDKPFHCNDVIMNAMASQIISLTFVYSTVYSGTDQRKHQSSALLAFVWGGFPAQRASIAANVSIWWRHHVTGISYIVGYFSCKWMRRFWPRYSVIVFMMKCMYPGK